MSALNGATVGLVQPVSRLPTLAPAPPSLDAESREWLQGLRAKDATGQEAIASLHALLLRAACFEVARRRPTLPHLRGDELEDIATEAADDALMSLEAAVKLRKRAWQGREVPLEPEGWGLFSSAGLEPDAEAEQSELLETLQSAIAEVLTPHQRRVLVALALNGVPIDVLAERLNTNRGALYKTLHDARRKLRNHLQERGLALDNEEKR
jgi:RNA polymerase sigma-70 factor (ECF subfamily)